MKKLNKLEFQEISPDESQDINGGVIALVLTAAGLCVLLYRAALASASESSIS